MPTFSSETNRCRMNLSPTAMICCAPACGTRGRPKRSASRRTAAENIGRISGANQRASTASTPAVTTTSARYSPVTPIPNCATSSSRTAIVAPARASVIALNVIDWLSIRSTWNGMNVKPIANVLISISRRRPCTPAAQQPGRQRRRREQQRRSRSRRSAPAGRRRSCSPAAAAPPVRSSLVEQPHERAVEPEPEDDLRRATSRPPSMPMTP